MKQQRKSIQDENDAFAAADSGAALTYPAAYNSLRKGGYVIIDDRPCRIVDTKLFKVGKHGHGKVSVVAIDIFKDKRHEVVQPSTHTAQVPLVKKQDFTLVDVGNLYMSLLDGKGNLKSDIHVPNEALTNEIREKMDNTDDNIMITVMSAMDEEKVISFKTARD